MLSIIFYPVILRSTDCQASSSSACRNTLHPGTCLLCRIVRVLSTTFGLRCAGPERTDELALLTALAGALTNSLLERHSKGGSGTLAQESLAGLAAANASLAVLL